MKFLKFLSSVNKVNDLLPSESSGSTGDGKKLYKRLNQVNFAVCNRRAPVKCGLRNAEIRERVKCGIRLAEKYRGTYGIVWYGVAARNLPNMLLNRSCLKTGPARPGHINFVIRG